jgi:hypothetical protein
MLLNRTSISGDHIKIQLVDLNEGDNGEYNPEDPLDEKLWRVDFYYRMKRKGAWQPFDDGSYCTQLPVAVHPKVVRSILIHMYCEITRRYNEGEHLKRVFESLSWVDPTWSRDDVWYLKRKEN